jgi:hypothetical protein
VHHIRFVNLDVGRVRQHLRHAGHNRRRIRQVLEHLSDCKGDLHAQCAVLRRKGRLKNVLRALVPLSANELVLKALKNWARQWPKSPNRLEVNRFKNFGMCATWPNTWGQRD